MKDEQTAAPTIAPSRVLVWDLPTRAFHWLMVALVIVSFVTANMGGNAMEIHEKSGCAILALLLFRVVWGFIGSRPSRFVAFLKGPQTVLRYGATLLRREEPPHLSHNPLGGWSVAAMLVALLIQAGTGLFANDDIATEGLLYKWVSKAVSDRLTSLHKLNQEILIVLVAVHVAAVFFHLLYKRDNLLTPMITGFKGAKSPTAQPEMRPTWLGALAAALSALAVYLLLC
jgi:cytochrome b